MRGPIRSVLLAALAVCAFGALTVGSASAATMEDEATAMLAIYGNPGSNGAAIPVGGGLGRNFGFGKNMLFQACEGCTPAIGKNLAIELEPAAGVIVKTEAKDSFIGGTLMSNKTGANNPLSFAIQFADFQDNILSVTGMETKKDPSYTDTFDRPWISEICSPAAVGEACKTDAQYKQGNKPGGVKIENVSFNIGPGNVFQGTVWGTWANGKEEGGKKLPPCITLETPAAGEPTLVGTQGEFVGLQVKKAIGKVCLVSANNDWYHVGTEIQEPIITIANT